VLAAGRRRRTAHLDVTWAAHEAGHPRLGLIVPRYQSTAVARNCLRRRIREIWRREIQQRCGAVDVVVRARREAYQAGFRELEAELVGWVGQLVARTR
jgi:ribonuclease P protein component